MPGRLGFPLALAAAALVGGALALWSALPPHDDTGHTWHHPDRMLFEITRHGIEGFAPDGYESDMPAFAGALSGDEIRAVLAFIKSHWGARERAFQERVTRMADEAR